MKNKKMIFLQGISKVGKTTVLHNLAQYLIDNGAKVLRERFIKADLTNDFWIILDYNNLKIGINTYGDAKFYMKNGIDKFENFDCDYIFCAMRTKGETVEYVDSFKTHNDVCIIKKMSTEYSDELQQKVDKKQLEILIDFIK